MELTDVQIERYSRQIILPAIGGRGQLRLLDSTISVIGEGSLAWTAALYLTAAGIGNLELLTFTAGGLDEMEAARRDLAALNPDTKVRVCPLHRAEIPAGSAALVCANVTAAVLDRVNRAALRRRAPMVAGAAGARAGIALYAGHRAGWPCAECDPRPPVCEPGEATDAAAGLIGTLLALEAVTSCLGLPDAQPGRTLHYDPQTLTINQCPMSKRPGCRACGASVTTDA